jgi:hypothetical protein
MHGTSWMKKVNKNKTKYISKVSETINNTRNNRKEGRVESVLELCLKKKKKKELIKMRARVKVTRGTVNANYSNTIAIALIQITYALKKSQIVLFNLIFAQIFRMILTI